MHVYYDISSVYFDNLLIVLILKSCRIKQFTRTSELVTIIDY